MKEISFFLLFLINYSFGLAIGYLESRNSPRTDMNMKCIASSNDDCYIICDTMISAFKNQINTVAKKGNCEIIKLHLFFMGFGKPLEKGWLNGVDYNIEELIMEENVHYGIASGSFEGGLFETIQRIEFRKETNFRTYPNFVLSGLTVLKELEITSNRDMLINDMAFNPIHQTLEVYKVSYINGTPLGSFFGRLNFKELREIHFTQNGFSGDKTQDFILQNMPKLRIVEMKQNSIETLEPNFVWLVADTVEVIDLRSNKLKATPKGFFSKFSPGQNLTIYLDDNPFSCECELLDLQEILSDPERSHWFPQPLFCTYPDDSIGYKIVNAEIECEITTTTELVTTTTTESTTTTSERTTIESSMIVSSSEMEQSTICDEVCETSTISTQTSTEPLNEDEYIGITCSKFEQEESRATGEEIFIKKPIFNFSLIEIQPGSVKIMLSQPQQRPYTILWFSEEQPDNKYISNENLAIRCQTNDDTAQTNIDHLELDQTYMFCLIDPTQDSVSPLDCLAQRIGESFKSSSNAWITNGDKILAISMVTLIVLICTIIGAAAGYFLIRYSPTMLRGSENVIVVKERNALDRNPSSTWGTAKPEQNNVYMTPIPEAIRKPSIQQRRASDSDYLATVSLDPSKVWQCGDGKTIYNLKDIPDTPPPLPPHPCGKRDSTCNGVCYREHFGQQPNSVRGDRDSGLDMPDYWAIKNET